MSTASETNTVAIIVTYFPDAQFPERLHEFLKQFPEVIIVDNGSQGDALEKLLHLKGSNVTLIRNFVNAGIATAFNQGLASAKNKHYEWVVTFDQDTLIAPDFLAKLTESCNVLGNDIGIVGNNYHDNHRSRTRFSASDRKLCKEVTTVISSGMFFSLGLTEKIGGFVEELFIDGVDHEFCLRARAHGYKVVLLMNPSMRHEIGKPLSTENPVLKRFLPYNHYPLRKYYIARNTLHNIRTYWKCEPLWCLKRIGALLLKLAVASFHPNRKLHLKALFLGMHDAVHGRLGYKDDLPS
jgi:rhamnosyltransferase